MGNSAPKYRSVLASGVLAAFALAALSVYHFRPPLLILTDDAFDGLYGPARVKKEEFLLSLRLFRPLREIRVASDASPDGATIAAVIAGGQGSRAPFGVFFPWRYRSAAEAYRRLYPSIPVAVLGGPSPAASGDGSFFDIPIDRRKDMLRAGIIAGMIADGTGKAVAAVPGGDRPEESLGHFKEGLSLGGFDGPLNLADAASPRPSIADTACVVVFPGVPSLPQFDPAVPAVWFTWIDPDLLPPHAAAVFDDSPLALAPELARAIKRTAAPVPLPSLLRLFPAPDGPGGDSLKKRILKKIDELDSFYAEKYLSAIK